MSRKSKTLSTEVAAGHPWLDLLKESHPLQTFLNDLQNTVEKWTHPLPINQQLVDIQFNIKTLAEYPLTSIQIRRIQNSLANQLNQTALSENDVAHYQVLFQDSIADQIQLTETSRYLVDPHCKTIRDFSSSITAYKQWLEKVLFIILAFNATTTALPESAIHSFLSQLNGVSLASTISRVRLRSQPKIDSVSFVEIPRNTAIKILSKPIDQHWVKISVDLDDVISEGYLQLAYILKE